MQQLDDSEIWKAAQEPPSEEAMKDVVVVDEGSPSPESPGKVDGPPLLPSEGRSEAKSILKLAPASPQRPVSAQAEESLPNGEMQGGDLSGKECSPEEAKAKETPAVADKGDHWPPQGGPEATSAANPVGQSPDPGKAPASRQRKLAMEEMVIRDHLGQEVGCMDAVGHNQASLEKEEETEDHTPLESRRDGGSQPGPVDIIVDQKETLGEELLGHELGGRDGPEGESPTSLDQPNPPGLLQNETNCLEGRGGGPLEVGSLAKEAEEKGVGQKAEPEQSAQGMDPALALATGADAPATESVKQSRESPEEDAEEGHRKPGDPGEQLAPSLPHPITPGPEEAKMPLLDLALPSSPTQNLAIPQDTAPSLQGMEESLLDQLPSQEEEGSLQDPEPPLVSSQDPPPPWDRNSSLPERKGSLLGQTPSSKQECLSDQSPPSLQDPLSSSLEIKPSSLWQEAPCLPEVKCSVTGQVPSSPHEADGRLSSCNPTRTGTQIASLLDQPISPLPEDEPSALQRVPSSWHELEKPRAQQGEELLRHESKGSLPNTVLSLTDQLSSLPDQMVSLPDTKISALEESPAALQGPMPRPPEPLVSPVPEVDASLPSQLRSSAGDPQESPIALLDQLPPVLPNTVSTSLMAGAPDSSLPEADGALPEATQTPLPSHPSLPEDEGSLPTQTPPTSEGQTTASLLGQTPSFQEEQNSSDPPEERSTLAQQTSSPNKAQSPVLRDPPGNPSALPLASQEALQPLLGKSETGENQDAAKGSGDPSMASAAGESTEVLENLQAEKQPLLKEAKGSGGDVSATGDLPSKAGVVKSQSNQRLNSGGSRASANTADSHQLQAALTHQGEGHEPEKAKRKSCQCCLLM